MRFYGTFETNGGLMQSPMIDYIEFEFDNVDPKFCPKDLDPEGVILSCDWDESDWDYDSNTGYGSFRCKGVYVNQVYANGHLDMFRTARVDTVQVFCMEKFAFRLTSLIIEDGEDLYEIPCEKVTPRDLYFELI